MVERDRNQHIDHAGRCCGTWKEIGRAVHGFPKLLDDRKLVPMGKVSER
jgi:hypothetical protein